jgi:magnesium chelatase family protein
MQSQHLRRWCPLDDSTRSLIEATVRKLGLSARGTDLILKVARTIADLDGAEQIQAQHVAEVIQYRIIDRMQ